MVKSLILNQLLNILEQNLHKNLCNSQNFPFIKIRGSHQDVCILK